MFAMTMTWSFGSVQMDGAKAGLLGVVDLEL